MDQLATYVAAIHRPDGPLAATTETVEQSSWRDQGFEVRRKVTEHRFGNGVVIRRTIEQDEFPSAASCAECWITYEVTCNGSSGIIIRPPRQVFANACREAFWLAYHSG